MVERVEVDLAGESVHLLAQRALYWPARARLLIADLHLGKGDTFRAAGIAVPSGGTADDLARLDALLRDTGARSLWILGDFLHAGHHPAVDAAWASLRRAHADVDVALVPGNHDRRLESKHAGLRMLRDGERDGPLAFHHAPPERVAPDAHVVCGHMHPVVSLPGLGRSPLFWRRDRVTVLPAFSRFSGGFLVPTRELGTSVLCHPDGLHPLRAR